MKRFACDSGDEDAGDTTFVYDGPITSDGCTLEKRNRSGASPILIGPLAFNSNGFSLDKTLYSAEPSSLPGVHRMSLASPTTVCLWSPHLTPPQQYIDADLQQVLQAINGKCIFIFDVRTHPTQDLLSNVVPLSWLLAVPSIQKHGIIVSKVEPSLVSNTCPIPYIQDPSNKLADLCKFHSYLGPSAVCVKNGELMATCMLSRSHEVLLTTFQKWDTI